MGILIDIESFGSLNLKYLVLDLNGTISFYGKIPSEMKSLISRLKEKLEIYLLSADTYGTAASIAEELGISLHKLNQKSDGADEKAVFVQKLGKDQVAALGNGRNDWKMVETAKLGFGILGEEGIARETLLHADIVVKSPMDALKMLLNPQSLRATLRG